MKYRPRMLVCFAGRATCKIVATGISPRKLDGMTAADELHDYLDRQNNNRAKRYHLSVDSRDRSSGIWIKEKVTAYRLTADAYGAGVADHISLSECKGEDGWDIFRWSKGEELEETDPELAKLLEAKKVKAQGNAKRSKTRA